MEKKTRAKGESLACSYRKPSKNANLFMIDAKLENVYKRFASQSEQCISTLKMYLNTEFNNIV